jgi:dihydroorotate dehydrogenase
MIYRAVRPFLFALDPETAHHVTLKSLDCLRGLTGAAFGARDLPQVPVQVMGLRFPNPVGLAAGLDKNGEHLDGLASLGFGFLEIGTVTPRPQPGNPRPRLFRIPEAQAVINRMGFNGLGVAALVENVKRSRYRGVLGINIGKNLDTPNERAADDYVAGLRAVYAHASFVTANVSSPNTKNLRLLQQADEMDILLGRLARERTLLAREHGRHVPIAVKVSPDLDDAGIEAIADRVAAHGIDAVIATNTTVSRAAVQEFRHGGETGGLSGPPVRELSTAILAKFRRVLPERIALIGVGGIASARDAHEKLDAGASLIQVYTGLLYRGPGLVGEIVRSLGREAVRA